MVDITSVVWSSSDESIATVETGNLLVVKAVGNVEISLLVNGKYKAKKQLTVLNDIKHHVTVLTIDPGNVLNRQELTLEPGKISDQTVLVVGRTLIVSIDELIDPYSKDSE